MIAPVLKNPYFFKEFIMYAYIFKKSIIIFLTQKEDNNYEHSITFFNQTLHDA